MIDLRAALRLYLVIGPANTSLPLPEAVSAAIRGGVTMIQLRDKDATSRELHDSATRLVHICRDANVPLIVNDRLDIALAVGADGVHLGVSDLPLEDARRLAGLDFIIGYSPEGEELTRSAASRSADYLGLGPVFGTSTKLDAGFALGLGELSSRIQLGNLPTVGIGGVTADNAADVIAAGADGVAVVSAILSANDIEHAARQISRNTNKSSTRGSSDGSQ